MFSIIVTDTFLNQLIGLSRSITKRVPNKIKILENDPISANGDAKKLDGKIYRVRVGTYRIIYHVGTNYVELLSVGHRSNIYSVIPKLNIDPRILDEEADEEIEPTEFENRTEQTDYYFKSIINNFIKNKNFFISQEHLSLLEEVKSEDDLLMLSLPDSLLSRLLDNLYPPKIEDIEKRKKYQLTNADDLTEFFEGNIKSFLLKLDPEQIRISEYKIGEPVLVKGGPGTGKSLLAIYRIQKLLEEGIKPILFTAHSSALVSYAKELLKELLKKDLEPDIKVTTVDSLINAYYADECNKKPEPPQQNSIQYLKEAIAEVKQSLEEKPLRLRAKFNNCIQKGENYILRQIEDVIESCGLMEKDDYIKFRSKDKLSKEHKEFIWNIYQNWKKKLTDNGYVSKEEPHFQALRMALENKSDRIYKALIIDEAQDLSPVLLKFLFTRVSDLKNVYVTADSEQSIYKRGFNWGQVHKNLKGYILSLNYNYRNTEEITSACLTILDYQDNYQPSSCNGEIPQVFLTDDKKEEIKKIIEFFKTSAINYHLPLTGSAILCPDITIAKEYEKLLSDTNLPAKYVENKDLGMEQPYIKILTMEFAKGLEFSFVAVVGLKQGLFPQISEDLTPEEKEISLTRQKRLLYVACSRAMRNLAVFGSKSNPSPFIELLTEPYWQIEKL